MIYITECPREAMQSKKTFIPTEYKVKYIQALIDVNFDFLDCGSFAFHELNAQLSDTEIVVKSVNKSNSNTKLSVIATNEIEILKACECENIDAISFPLSVSEKFQKISTNTTIDNSLSVIKNIQKITEQAEKSLSVYLSMSFGNSYGENWNTDLVENYVKKLSDLGITFIKLSDTIGVADNKSIEVLFSNLISKYPNITFSAHFRTEYNAWFDKINIAYENGCRNFDGAIHGYGGCPLLEQTNLGNIPTEKLVSFIQLKKEKSQIKLLAFESAFNKALAII